MTFRSSSSRAPAARTPTSGVLIEALFAASVLATAAFGALAVALGGRPRAQAPAPHEEEARDEPRS